MMMAEFNKEVEVSVPPAQLLNKHSGFEAFGNSMRCMIEDEEAKTKAEYKRFLHSLISISFATDNLVLAGKKDFKE